MQFSWNLLSAHVVSPENFVMQGLSVGAVIGVGVVVCVIMVVGGGGGTAIVNPLMPMHSPSSTASMDVHSEDV